MSEFDEITFRQHPGISSEAISLRRDRVVIHQRIGGESDDQHYRLEDVSESIERADRRFFGTLVTALVFAAIFAGAAWKVHGVEPLESALAILFGTLSLSSIGAGWVGCEPIEVATVRSTKGTVLFQLRRNQNVAADYGMFVLQLERALKRTHAT